MPAGFSRPQLVQIHAVAASDPQWPQKRIPGALSPPHDLQVQVAMTAERV
jgi:hypothetical protein